MQILSNIILLHSTVSDYENDTYTCIILISILDLITEPTKGYKVSFGSSFPTCKNSMNGEPTVQL